MAAGTDLGDKGLKVAEMVRSGDAARDAIRRAEGVWESRGVGNSYLLTTDDGDVLVNAGTLGDARRGRERFARASNSPVRDIVLTQSHANQYGGLEIFKTSENRVIAHRLYPAEREYAALLSPHYRRGSRRIFGPITGRTEDMVPTREVPADLLIGDEGYVFERGGRRFELIWTPGGETRSALIVWLPEERIALVGNLFGPLFGNQPNLNTLRGDKPRSALEFIASVHRARALKPDLLLTGHEAIEGAANIDAGIGRIADAVQWLHDETVAGMNDGRSLHALMHEVKPPPELALTEEYGKVAWNVRAIWHEYTGWFDATRGTTDLYGVPPASIAPALVKLAGGAEVLADRARAFVDEGKPLEALHLLDIALAADPTSEPGRVAKRAALELLDRQTGGTNLWERRWIASEIQLLDGPATW